MGRAEFGSAGLLWGLVDRLGSGLNMAPPRDWEPETATEHKLPNLASRNGRQWPAGWESCDDRKGTAHLKMNQALRQARLARMKGTHLSPDNRVPEQWTNTHLATQCKWTHTHTGNRHSCRVCLHHVHRQDRKIYSHRCARHTHALVVQAPSQLVTKERPASPNTALSRGSKASAP